MRLTAFPPPPPTPMTLILAGGAASWSREIGSDGCASSSKRIIFCPPSISQCGGRGEEILQGTFHLREEARSGLLAGPRGSGGGGAPVEKKTRGTGPLRRGNDVRESAEAARNAAPDGDAERLLGHFEEPVEVRAPARQDET